MDLEKDVIKSLNQEFSEYKKKELNKSTEAVFDNSFKNNFYLELRSFFCNIDMETDDLKNIRSLHKECGFILHNLYGFYLDNEFSSITNFGEINEMLSNYVDSNHEKAME